MYPVKGHFEEKKYGITIDIHNLTSLNSLCKIILDAGLQN